MGRSSLSSVAIWRGDLNLGTSRNVLVTHDVEPQDALLISPNHISYQKVTLKKHYKSLF